MLQTRVFKYIFDQFSKRKCTNLTELFVFMIPHKTYLYFITVWKIITQNIYLSEPVQYQKRQDLTHWRNEHWHPLYVIEQIVLRHFRLTEWRFLFVNSAAKSFDFISLSRTSLPRTTISSQVYNFGKYRKVNCYYSCYQKVRLSKTATICEKHYQLVHVAQSSLN